MSHFACAHVVTALIENTSGNVLTSTSDCKSVRQSLVQLAGADTPGFKGEEMTGLTREIQNGHKQRQMGA